MNTDGIVTGYAVIEPNGDRVYFWHHISKEYQAAMSPDTRVYEFQLVLNEAQNVGDSFATLGERIR